MEIGIWFVVTQFHNIQILGQATADLHFLNVNTELLHKHSTQHLVLFVILQIYRSVCTKKTRTKKSSKKCSDCEQTNQPGTPVM